MYKFGELCEFSTLVIENLEKKVIFKFLKYTFWQIFTSKKKASQNYFVDGYQLN